MDGTSPRWVTAARAPEALDQHVIQDVHPKDGMLGGNLPYYQSVGRDAARIIAVAMLQAQSPTPKHVLDFACGHGRVGRYLRAQFPDAEITFSDLDSIASAFCANAFHGKMAAVTENFESYSVNGPVDLIWVGSLFTHLKKTKSAQLLQILYGLLAPGGLLVLTLCGRYVASRRAEATSLYKLTADDFHAMVSQSEQTGYGFGPYQGTPNYGLSLTYARWWDEEAAKLPGAEVVLFAQRGWIRHQDVVAIKKAA